MVLTNLKKVLDLGRFPLHTGFTAPTMNSFCEHLKNRKMSWDIRVFTQRMD